MIPWGSLSYILEDHSSGTVSLFEEGNRLHKNTNLTTTQANVKLSGGDSDVVWTESPANGLCGVRSGNSAGNDVDLPRERMLGKA